LPYPVGGRENGKIGSVKSAAQNFKLFSGNHFLHDHQEFGMRVFNPVKKGAGHEQGKGQFL
jgi:hypothetical protein